MSTLIGSPVEVVNVGARTFAEDLVRREVPVASVAWSPPSPEASEALGRLSRRAEGIGQANDRTVARLTDARPILVGIAPARDVIPGMDDRTFLHAGPPIGWDQMCGPMRGAILGAAMFEGLATHPEEAGRKADAGSFSFAPCHERDAVAPMAGVISPSMPVWIVQNEDVGNRAHCVLNEGMGRVLRFGAFHEEHLVHLAWVRDVLAPALDRALRNRAEALDVRNLIAQALQMGDECHNRHKASSALFMREIAPSLVGLDIPTARLVEVVSYLRENEIFFLNPTMAAAKATADAGSAIPHSTLVTAMTRNGVEFGLRLSGTGERWFTAPASIIEGLYFPGFGAEDANPDLGDSAITETVGLGGMAVAASPAVVQVVGGSPERSLSITRSMYEIAWSESPYLRIPTLGFRGVPLGIDAREVVHSGILPVINTGIAHREPGFGQIGAGVVRPPMETFIAAIKTLAQSC